VHTQSHSETPHGLGMRLAHTLPRMWYGNEASVNTCTCSLAS